VTGGWLEHEIRSLPQVLACSITGDDIVVLVQPAADPVAVERAVTDLLRARGVDLPVRVFGGARPMFVEPVKIRNGRPALAGALGGALVLAAGVWLAGSGVGLRGNGTGSRSQNTTELVLAPPVVRDLVSVPAGGGGPQPEPPEPPTPPADVPSKPILRPVSRGPILTPPKPPSSGPGPAPAPGPQPPGPGPQQPPTGPAPEPPAPPDGEVPTTVECERPKGPRVIVPKVKIRGEGSPPWAHKHHVRPHCDNGR
jgi:hypothetical protein